MSEYILDIHAVEAYVDSGALAISTTVRGSLGAKAKSLVPVRIVPRTIVEKGSEIWTARASDIKTINEKVKPLLQGMSLQEPDRCDAELEKMRRELSGEAMAAVSTAIHKANAVSMGVPLYAALNAGEMQVLPIPSNRAVSGSRRYGGPASVGIAPSYSFSAANYNSFEEAHYALWEVVSAWAKKLSETLDMKMSADSDFSIPVNRVESDEPLLELMSETIEKTGNSGGVGIVLNYSAKDFYCDSTQSYKGIFSCEPILRHEMPELITRLVHTYPIIIAENPVYPEDISLLTDAFSKKGVHLVLDSEIEAFPGNQNIPDGICISVTSSTVSAAKRFADRVIERGSSLVLRDNGYEDDELCDYSVSLGCDMIRDRGLSFTGNRLLQIEKELGRKAVFAGFPGYKKLR